MKHKWVQAVVGAAMVIAVAAVMLLSWKVEGRSRVDTSVERYNARQAQARVAAWALPLAMKLKELESEMTGLEPDSASRGELSEKIRGLRNLIASKVPSLSTGRDARGDAVLKPVDSVLQLLLVTSTAAGGRLSEHDRLQKMPAELSLFTALADYLDDGWYDPELATGTLRFTKERATLEIKNDPALENVAISMLWLPPGSGPGTGKVYINGELAGSFTVTSASPEKFLFPKPAGTGDTLKIRIENDVMIVPDDVVQNGDRRKIGVAVERVWQE